MFIYFILISSVDALEKLKNADIRRLENLKGEWLKIHKKITGNTLRIIEYITSIG